jgi:endoglucanase
VAAAAAAAEDDGTALSLLGRADRLDRRVPTYYGAAWVALGRMMLQTTLIGSCPPLH